jgi:Lar family restriction alleviation protein
MTKKKDTSDSVMITADCPFCGSVDSYIRCQAAVHRVYCHSCDTAGPAGGSEDNAIRLWNMRARDWP